MPASYWLDAEENNLNLNMFTTNYTADHRQLLIRNTNYSSLGVDWQKLNILYVLLEIAISENISNLA
jgi:hypothetical protein